MGRIGNDSDFATALVGLAEQQYMLEITPASEHRGCFHFKAWTKQSTADGDSWSQEFDALFRSKSRANREIPVPRYIFVLENVGRRLAMVSSVTIITWSTWRDTFYHVSYYTIPKICGGFIHT